MKTIVATLIKYLLLSVMILGVALLMAVGAYIILGKYLGYSTMLAVLISLVATIGAAIFVAQILPLLWDRYAATHSNEMIPNARLVWAGRFGDLSNEWFACDASLEVEYADFSLPHFQPSRQVLEKRRETTASTRSK